MNILSQLIKARFALKRKFENLKQVKNRTNLQVLRKIKKQMISKVKDSIKVKRELMEIKKYDDDERELDDFLMKKGQRLYQCIQERPIGVWMQS